MSFGDREEVGEFVEVGEGGVGGVVAVVLYLKWERNP